MADTHSRSLLAQSADPADTTLLAEAGPDESAGGNNHFAIGDAVEIWIARWLRIPVKELVLRYGCDSRRIYEIWWGERFPGSRAKAEIEFRRRFPALADRTSYGYRRIPRVVPARGQLALFE